MHQLLSLDNGSHCLSTYYDVSHATDFEGREGGARRARRLRLEKLVWNLSGVGGVGGGGDCDNNCLLPSPVRPSVRLEVLTYENVSAAAAAAAAI